MRHDDEYDFHANGGSGSFPNIIDIAVTIATVLAIGGILWYACSQKPF